MSEQEVVRLQEQVKTLFSDISEIRNSMKVVDEKLDKIRSDLEKRVPAWATALIALLTGMVGWLL